MVQIGVFEDFFKKFAIVLFRVVFANTKPRSGKILVLQLYPKMLSANQIAESFDQQYSRLEWVDLLFGTQLNIQSRKNLRSRFSNQEEGKEMLSLNLFDCLISMVVDIKERKNLKFFYLVGVVRYAKFVRDPQRASRLSGGRYQMDSVVVKIARNVR